MFLKLVLLEHFILNMDCEVFEVHAKYFKIAIKILSKCKVHIIFWTYQLQHLLSIYSLQFWLATAQKKLQIAMTWHKTTTASVKTRFVFSEDQIPDDLADRCHIPNYLVHYCLTKECVHCYHSLDITNRQCSMMIALFCSCKTMRWGEGTIISPIEMLARPCPKIRTGFQIPRN